ncbi:MAG: calcium-binding protein [Planctomycetes bacterium]|nr:calcium-binding protein [Planctomycetota bacterium]MBI3833631.1 calcium-binding protein [Planctomycetota bacterium]
MVSHGNGETTLVRSIRRASRVGTAFGVLTMVGLCLGLTQIGTCGGKKCQTNADCDDSNGCTTDTCSAGSCSNTAACDATHCVNKGCLECLTDAECDDSDVCTTDACTAGACSNTAITACCTADADCDDTDACTTDTCDANTHTCSNAAVPSCCNDDAGCDDGDACTDDTCDTTAHTCANTPKTCATGETCVNGVCQTNCLVDADCDDSNACTTDACDATTSTCTHADKNCDDSVACTDDGCDTTTGTCTHTDNCTGGQVCDTATGACSACTTCTTDADCADDGVFCNGTESCDTTASCCTHSGNPCTAPATCDETTNACVEPGGTTTRCTLGTDNLTGGTGTDTFDCSLEVSGGVFFQTINNADRYTGSSSTDTLTAQFKGGGTTTPSSLDSVEVLNLEVTDTNATTLSLANANAVTTLNSNNGLAALTVSNATTAPTDFGMTNNTQNFTVTVVNTALAGNADTATLTLNATTAGTLAVGPVSGTNGYESLTVDSEGNVANVLTDLQQGTGTSLARVDVSGTQDVNLGSGLDNSVTTVNATGFTGKLTVTMGTNTATVTGGEGDDTIIFGAAYTTADTIDCGAGTGDILSLTTATAAGTSAAQSNVTHCEGLTVSDQLAGNVNGVHFGATTVTLHGGVDGTNRTVTLASGGTVQLDAGAGANLVIAASPNTSSDTMTLTMKNVTITGNLDASVYETLNIASSTGANIISGTTAVNNPLGSGVINVTGDQNLTFTGAITANSLNASTFTGALTVTGTAANAIAITGGSGADTLNGSASGDTINGGAGNDTINGGAGADTMTGGAGNDTFDFDNSVTAGSASDTVSDWVDGSDLIGISGGNTFAAGGATGLAQGGGAAGSLAATAAGSVVVTSVAQNASAAAIGTTQFVKLTTGVANAGSDQATFNAAIGTATLTGTTAATSYAGSYYDTTNSQMVVFEVLSTATTTTVIETGDVIRIIVKVSMSATDYSNFTTSDILVY